MSFLGIPTSRQDLGNAGWIKGALTTGARGLANVGSALPGSDPGGVQTARNFADAVDNPNMGYSGTLNPLAVLGQVNNSGSVFTAVPQSSSSPQVQGAAVYNSDTVQPGGNSYSGTGGGASNAALGAAYDAKINALQGFINDLPGQQDTQNNILNGQFAASRAGLDTSYNRNSADLSNQSNQITQNRARSLNDLASRGRNLMQAMNNQLGAMGAGSSSASEVLAPYAIAQQQNRLGGDINRQAQTQFSAVDLQKKRLDEDYQTNVQSLEQNRLAQLLQVSQTFADMARQYQSDLQGATAEKAQALGGQYAATVDQVNQAIANIEGNYRARLNDVNNYYKSYTPQAYGVNDVSNSVQNINTAGFDAGVNPTATQQQVAAAYTGADDPNKQQPLILF